MKAKYAIALLPALAACGSSSSDSNDPGLLADEQSDSFNAAGPVVNACASNYYSELAGLYNGQIEYTSNNDSLSCTWDVDLQVSSGYQRDSVNRTVCDLSMNMISTSSNPEGCSDIGVSGDISEPLNDASNSSVWSSPPWPIEADSVLGFGLSGSDVYPIGEEGGASTISFRFDGQGNARYPDSSEGSWSGVLVKQ